MIDEPVIGVLGLVLLLLMIFLRIPLGFAMAFVGFVGFTCISNVDAALSNLSSVPYEYLTDYNFIVLPLFLLMGNLASYSGISRDLYQAAYAWLGGFRGGLCMATIGAAAGFSAICGSSTATAAALARIAYPEMTRLGYDPRLATGVLAAGGTMGILIPPSIAFITYAMLTEESIGLLFMAGIIPGVLEAIFYMLTVLILCSINPSLGPKGEKTPLKMKILSLRQIWAMLLLFIWVMGGIYFGLFTPTEAGALGALGALLIGLAMRRIDKQKILQAMLDTGRITALIYLLIIGSMIFQRFMAISNLPSLLSEYLTSVGWSKYLSLALILLFYLIAGCFLDVFSVLVLTVPIIFPTIKAWGFDPIWFGVLFVRVAEVGMITPPFGMNVFVIAGAVGQDTKIVFRGVWPFVVADLFHIALLVAFPQIALWLPRRMG